MVDGPKRLHQYPAEVSGDECIHGLTPATCTTCRLNRRPHVYITGGGASYHTDRDCPARRRGQNKIDRKGGDVANLELVSRSEADRRGYAPCGRCGHLASLIELQPPPTPRKRRTTTWVCFEEWAHPSLQSDGLFHDRRKCEALADRVQELGGKSEQMDRDAARRCLKPCPTCVRSES